MEENEQVVNPEESTPLENQEEVNETQESSSPEVSEPETQAPAEVGKPQVDDTLDEFGVPWKNRAMEWKRKAEKEREERERSLQSQQVQSQPQRQYSIAELEAFALETDNPAHKQWALNEAERLRENKYAETVRKELEAVQKKSETERIKQQTIGGVVSRNPDIVIKDADGNFLGWNQNSPLFRRMQFYLNDAEIQSNPRGFEVAEALAFRDIARRVSPVVNKALNKANNTVKNLQKKTLIEGGGSQDVQQVSPLQAAEDRVRQTGDGKDATVFFKEYFKKKGVLPEG